MGRDGRKGPIERFADGVGQVIVFVLILWLVWYLVNGLVETIRDRRWDRVIKFGVVLFMFWTLSKCMEQENIRQETKAKEQRDNRSGHDIWKEKMKDYDAERGY